MEKTDGLSRQLDWKVGVDKDNENQVFIKDNWIRSIQEVVIEVSRSKKMNLIYFSFHFLFSF